ncbi:MAG: hypothetical protein KAX38_03475 [Candidatus Krumholzibacteria bacterium]|nr:hypothetical protein [Candidatus Krumholzibacteria bacterium]
MLHGPAAHRKLRMHGSDFVRALERDGSLCLDGYSGYNFSGRYEETSRVYWQDGFSGMTDVSTALDLEEDPFFSVDKERFFKLDIFCDDS